MIKDIVSRLYPLYRTIVSDDLDRGLEVVGEFMPHSSDYRMEEFNCGEARWTWEVPHRYHVEDAYLEIEHGERVADFKKNPLHLVSYSQPIERVMSWEQLAPHLHVSTKRPGAIPWVFKYYEKTWGFCISKNIYDRLPRDKKYRAVIRSEFRKKPGLKLGMGIVHPEGGPTPERGEIIVSAHICHPLQANDNASAVAVAVEAARRLAEKPLPAGSSSVRFLFPPETVGSVCYLSAHEDLIPRLKAGIVCESIGNRNSLAVQHSWPGGALIDRVADAVLKKRVPDHRSLAAWTVFSADEKVINGPGVSVPTIMLTRAPYEEYHTSDDNLEIIDEGLLQEDASVMVEVIRMMATNYTPQRTFRGPVHLSRSGLWIDYQKDRQLSLAMQQAMLYFEGKHTVFDIAEALKTDYWVMWELVERYRSKGFVIAS